MFNSRMAFQDGTPEYLHEGIFRDETVQHRLQAEHTSNAATTSHKVFVRCLPAGMQDTQLKLLFSMCGAVEDLVLCDGTLGSEFQGCALVTFASRGDADRAVAAFHGKLTMPGSSLPLEVHHIGDELVACQDRDSTDTQEARRQLFFAHVPIGISETDVKQLFIRFGQVVEFKLLQDKQTLLSRGCGFVTYATVEAAQQAAGALDNTHAFGVNEPTFLVRWAESELQHKIRRAAEEADVEQRTLFFARVLRSATEEEVKQLFQQFGSVLEVNLFRAFQGAPNTKGCGLVTMGSRGDCERAIASLDGMHIWPRMSAPMVVKWMDGELQRRRRAEYLSAMRQGALGVLPAPAAAAAPSNSSLLLGLLPGSVPAASQLQPATAAQPLPAEDIPPAGCESDAIKLFIGNLPRHFDDKSLRVLFEPYGKIVELIVIRDRQGQSKCSALLWFATKLQALSAAAALNGLKLKDAGTNMPRRLVVRPALSRRQPEAQRMMPSFGQLGAQACSSSDLHVGQLPVSPAEFKSAIDYLQFLTLCSQSDVQLDGFGLGQGSGVVNQHNLQAVGADSLRVGNTAMLHNAHDGSIFGGLPSSHDSVAASLLPFMRADTKSLQPHPFTATGQSRRTEVPPMGAYNDVLPASLPFSAFAGQQSDDFAFVQKPVGNVHRPLEPPQSVVGQNLAVVCLTAAQLMKLEPQLGDIERMSRARINVTNAGNGMASVVIMGDVAHVDTARKLVCVLGDS